MLKVNNNMLIVCISFYFIAAIDLEKWTFPDIRYAPLFECCHILSSFVVLLQWYLVSAVVILKVAETFHPSHQWPMYVTYKHVCWVTLNSFCTFSKSVCSTRCWVSKWSFSDSSSLLCWAISSCWLEEEALCAISWSQLARALFLSDDSLSCSCWKRKRSLDHNSFSFVRDLYRSYCYTKWHDLYYTI